MTQEQLTTIGDVYNLLSPEKKGKLSPIQKAAMALADEMTTQIQLRDEVFETLRQELANNSNADIVSKELTEAVATASVYNMVSRFLVALDVEDHAKIPCPVPGLPSTKSEPSNTLPYPSASYSYDHGLVEVAKDVQLATRVHFHSVQAPWILFVNSLMTNLTMWDAIIPEFSAHFNIVTYDQRGHGFSSIPPEEPKCTLEQLADDIVAVMDALGITKLHSVIGVSQGGATALAFALRHGRSRTDHVVACDTQPVSPQANIAAWDDRIALARSQGMGALAVATVPRWFDPQGSKATEIVRARVSHMIASTAIEGFARSARSLQGYDLVSQGLKDAVKSNGSFKTLLLAGGADGKLPEVLQGFSNEVGVEFAKIQGAGHLPMCDAPKDFVNAVLPFLLQK